MLAIIEPIVINKIMNIWDNYKYMTDKEIILYGYQANLTDHKLDNKIISDEKIIIEGTKRKNKALKRKYRIQ